MKLLQNLKVGLKCKGMDGIRFKVQKQKTTREKFREHKSVVYVTVCWNEAILGQVETALSTVSSGLETS